MNHLRQHRFFIAVLASLLILVGFVAAADASQVRVVYFVPNDRSVQWTIPAALDTQMKAVQQFYEDQMTAHGYSNKTFEIETGTTGNLVVHHLTGKYGDSYYHTDTLNKIHTEIKPRFDTENDVYAVFVDISTERVNGSCGIAYFEGGPAMFPVSGECVTGGAGVDLIAHELGHAFNLEHDFRDDTYIMSYGADRNQLSKCGAEYLNVSPYFNGRIPTADTPGTIEMLSGATPPETGDWQPQFSVSDPDGLYQVQFLHSFPNFSAGIIECQRIQGTSTEITVTMPAAEGKRTHNIWLRVVDNNGNIKTQDWVLTSSSEVESTRETEIKPTGDFTYLTFTYDSPDALLPINHSEEWTGWIIDVWEKTPDGKYPPKHEWNYQSPYLTTWDHWLYGHAKSRIVYDLSGGNYVRFNAYLDMPHPRRDNASIQIICLADTTEIYKSEVLKGEAARNKHITFDIPENTEMLTINVSDMGNNSNDHFVFGNPRLLHGESTTHIMGVYPDVNSDGVVNLVDLVIVASRYGETITGDPMPNPDVNRDGIVDVKDIILITDEMPVGVAPTSTPIATQLLPNYPNPFNPETWIPYMLSEPSHVAISIYAIDGRRVRYLDVGFQDAGFHINKHKAAYWDGRNEYGEPIASGVYFYTFTTDRLTATQKMLITK